MRLVLDKGIWLWATQVTPVRVAALTAAGRAAEAERLLNAFEDGLPGRDMPAPHAGLEECRAVLLEGRGELQAAERVHGTSPHKPGPSCRGRTTRRGRSRLPERCSRAARGTRPSGRRGYGERLSPRELRSRPADAGRDDESPDRTGPLEVSPTRSRRS